jgi:hypothetical protein
MSAGTLGLTRRVSRSGTTPGLRRLHGLVRVRWRDRLAGAHLDSHTLSDHVRRSTVVAVSPEHDADAVLARGCLVIHLFDSRRQEHRLHPKAGLEGTRVVYDVGNQASLGV